MILIENIAWVIGPTAGIVIPPVTGILVVINLSWTHWIVMQRFLIYILFILLQVTIFAQSEIDTVISGKVSYRTVDNIYVRFNNTEGINKGDTLFIKKGREFIPVIEVSFISSKSVSGAFIGKSELKISDEVFAFVKLQSEGNKQQSEISQPLDITNEDEVNVQVKKYNQSNLNESSVRGKFSV